MAERRLRLRLRLSAQAMAPKAATASGRSPQQTPHGLNLILGSDLAQEQPQPDPGQRKVKAKAEVLAGPPRRRPLTVAPPGRPRPVSTSSSVQTSHKNNLNLAPAPPKKTPDQHTLPILHRNARLAKSKSTGNRNLPADRPPAPLRRLRIDLPNQKVFQ